MVGMMYGWDHPQWYIEYPREVGKQMLNEWNTWDIFELEEAVYRFIITVLLWRESLYDSKLPGGPFRLLKVYK